VISEPELTDGFARVPAPADPRDAAGRTRPAYGHDPGTTPGPPPDLVAGTGREPAPPRRMPRHWIWALGGALTASAVWAGGVAVWDPAHHTPDLHGYHLTPNPCSGSDLTPLFAATPGHAFSADPADTLWGSALDRTRCSAENLGEHKGGSTYQYSATLSVELHKKTDPRPEFDDQHRTVLSSVSRIETVRGLGDEAYLLHVEPGTLQLDVLDGGAVITLAFSADADLPDVTPHPDGSDRPAPPDTGGYAPRMAAAVRNVMAEMKALPRPGGSHTP
jgi:hypothetical protein